MIRLSVERITDHKQTESMLNSLILRVMQQMNLHLNQCSKCESKQLLKEIHVNPNGIKIHIQDLVIKYRGQKEEPF